MYVALVIFLSLQWLVNCVTYLLIILSMVRPTTTTGQLHRWVLWNWRC